MSNGGTVVEFSAGMRVGPDERYEIVRICGRGGMGVVYEAIDHGLDRPRKVALKQLNKVFAGDPRHIDNIRREVALARDLGHPNIVRVYDYVNWRDEHLVIMEWMAGDTLVEELYNQEEKRFTPDKALKLLKPIAAALDYAHKRKPPVVHRDLKPLNVMLTEDGEVKVTDFGLSREVKESVTRVTGKDSSGSLEYMPFEQYMGDPPAPVHDIYALGITAYELLNGQPPFTRGDLGLQHKDKTPATIADIPQELMDVLLKCLAKDEKERYASTGEFIEAFEEALKADLSVVAERKQKAEAQRVAEEKRLAEEKRKAAEKAEKQKKGVDREKILEKKSKPVKNKKTLIGIAVVIVLIIAGFLTKDVYQDIKLEKAIVEQDPKESVKAELKEKPEAGKKEKSSDWYKKGTLFYNQGQFEEAVNSYNKAIEVEPENTTLKIDILKKILFINSSEMENGNTIYNRFITRNKISPIDLVKNCQDYSEIVKGDWVCRVIINKKSMNRNREYVSGLCAGPDNMVCLKISPDKQRKENRERETTSKAKGMQCKDIDGNTYETIQIGTQLWMQENLKVTHYNDGSEIPNITNKRDWGGISTGAYCDFGKNPTNSETYGKLYNWFAVNDERGLCPNGFDVPSDDEWQILIDYLGGHAIAGGKMKEAGLDHWNSGGSHKKHQKQATNESGFTALGAGYRNSSGNYLDLGNTGYFWSSTKYNTYNAWYRQLGYGSNSSVHRNFYGKRWGISIRCLGD